MFSKVLLSLPIALLAATTSYAQTVKAEIPFEFSVGQKVLPAGTYTFDSSLTPGVVCVRSANRKENAMAIANNAGNPNHSGTPKIVFSRYGENHFLSQVVYDSGAARQLPKSHREIELLARGPAKKEVLLASK